MAPFDATFTTKISPLIEGQVPDFIQADHPKFVQFLKQYYQFLEAAELMVDGIVDNVILENTDTQYLLDEAGLKVVTETGTGSTGKFTEEETITGATSKATATVLVDDLINSRLFISANQRFKIGETVTGGTSGATATITSYRANPVQTIQQLLDYANPDNTVDALLDEMRNQFMAAIPNTLASGTSKRNLIKNIRDLYTAKGTSEGHKLFLRLMFDEEATIVYPNKYMLRVSDGNWNKKTIIRCVAQSGSLGREIIGQTLTGSTSGASCFIVNAITFAQGSDSITEFEIDVNSVDGTFQAGETVKADSTDQKVEMGFTIQKIVSDSTIDNGGILYSSGDTLVLDSSIGNGNAVAEVDEVGLGSLDEVVIDDAGTKYRVGDVLTFTTTELNTDPAEGFVSAVGGTIQLESGSADSDNVVDFLVQEESTNSSLYNNVLALDGTDSTESNAGDALLMEGTDSSSTDAGDFLIEEQSVIVLDRYGTDVDRIVYEEGTFGSTERGGIARVFLSSKGIGYASLPTITVSSVAGTDTKLIPTTKDIGKVLAAKIFDAGFNYTSAPDATFPANFIVKDVTGEFTKDNTLTTHIGTVTEWDSDSQILRATFEDVVRVQMEQDSDEVNQNIQQEVGVDIEERIQYNNLLEDADGKILSETSPADIFVLNADTTGIDQITLENTGTVNQSIQLEEKRPNSMDQNVLNTTTRHRSMLNYLTGGPNLILDGTAVGGSFLIENGGTDGSGTNAGDEILLDRTTAGGADAGDKLIQQDDNEGDDILFEDELGVVNLQQRKDKFQLNGTSTIQLDNSHEVFVPATTGDNFILDGTNASGDNAGDAIVMNAFSSSGNNLIGAGDNIRLEGRPSYIYSEPILNPLRYVDERGGILLEDNLQYDTTGHILDQLILEGGDVNGFYNIFEQETVSHAGDSSDRLITEGSDGLIREDSIEGLSGGAGGDIRLNNHLLTPNELVSKVLMNQSGAAGDDAGSFILNENFGDSIVQESGLISGANDSQIGDKILYESEGMPAGDILLDGTDSSSSNQNDNIINESGIDLVGATITDSGGATATIVASNIATGTMSNDFVSTKVGEYQNIDSLVSEDVIRIQDSYYYQDFSYEVRMAQSFTTYVNELKKAVHPAGFKPFGKFTLASLISATLPIAGTGIVDIRFSPVLASALDTIFDLRIQKRIGIPKNYVEGSYFEELRLESGTLPGTMIMDGTNYGTELESADGALALESSANDGDNILITGSDDGSQDDAGGSIIINATDASGTDDGDVTGEYGSILLNGTDSDSTDAGDNVVLSGSALGVYNLVSNGTDALILLDGFQLDGAGAGFSIILNGTDSSSTNAGDRILSDTASEINSGESLVLNGTDNFPTGNPNRIMHEDGDSAGDNIITNRYALESITTVTGGAFVLESAVSNISGPYLLLNGTDPDSNDGNDKIISENYAVSISDAALYEFNDNISYEDFNGDNINFESGIIGGGHLMSEASVGTPGADFDVNFIRLLKTKISIPQPKPVTSMGLVHMGLNAFGDSVGLGNIQLEDGLRKRGPTINIDRLILDGNAPNRDDVITDVGEPMGLEDGTAVNWGSSLTFDDFDRFKRDNFVTDGTDAHIVLNGTDSSASNADDVVILDGTDGSSTDAGDRVLSDTASEIFSSNLVAEDMIGGILKTEDLGMGVPLIDFIRPDNILMETSIFHTTDTDRFVLNGTDSSSSHQGYFLVLDGTDSSSTDDGDNIISETYNPVNPRSYDNTTNVGIIMEGGMESGALILENNTTLYLHLETGTASVGDRLILNGTDSSSTNAGEDILMEFATAIPGEEILLEEGTDAGIGYKLILDSQRIEAETGSSEGTIPRENFFDNSVFPSYTRPTEVLTRPHGHLKLQDDRELFDIVLDGTDSSGSDEGSYLALNGTAGDGTDIGDDILLEGTDAAGTDRGDNILIEMGGFDSIDLRWDADTSTFDSDTLGMVMILNGTIADQTDVGGKIESERFLYSSIQHDGFVVLNGTDGSSTNAGGYLDWENGTYASLIGTSAPFLPPGFQAETYDNTDRTTFDNTSQTYDVLEGF